MGKDSKRKSGKKSESFGRPKASPSNRRIRILALFVFFAAVSICLKLYFLQVKAYGYYSELADNQHSVLKNLFPKRGEIFLKDHDGLRPVAVNKETKMAYAIPREIEDPRGVAAPLSSALGLDRNDLEERLSRPDDMYEPLKHRLSDEEIAAVNDLKLPGIHLADESYRYYPASELAAHVLGFVGWKDNQLGGRYGAELSFEDRLRGEAGHLVQKGDNSGGWIATKNKDVTSAKDGDNLVLTIDDIIQYETEKILKASVEKFEADRGTIIVMDPPTGKILAMANYPTFNPNEYGKTEDMDAFRNLAISDAYEPGSIFKAFTLAAALDDGKISPDTTYTDTGTVNEAGYAIKNSDFKANGVQTMTQVLEKSLNTGVIFAEKLVGNKDFADYVRRFGFGAETDVDLFGEAEGNINNLKDLKSNIQFFTSAFGQGITATPIQLAAAYNAIANGGVLVKPQIVDRFIHPDGSEETVPAQEVRRVISQQADAEIAQMLRSVVTDGHGKRADVPGYLVGGKTGTAQVASNDSKGYADGKSIGSFAGFAPINNPKYTVLVRLDDPKNVEWAESSAAPTFGELMAFLLKYGRVEPTESYTQKNLDDFNATHTLKDYFADKEKEEDKKNTDGQDNNSSSSDSAAADKR
ncbi:MAG: penicillin-binding protein 2 [Candidatus Moranbacteria bacterium]|nr:penicillin-binding protein 2 [Candidatus Moranbacteria bacterium]